VVLCWLRMPRSERTLARGFTLVELMTTVVIVGILAVVAYAAYGKFVTYSHTTEVNSVLSGIKNRQEAYKAETGIYLGVSSTLAANQNTSGWNTALYPHCTAGLAVPGVQKVAWPSGACSTGCCVGWQKLKVQTTAPTYYGFTTIAGAGGTPTAAVSIDGTAIVWPAATGPWFIATGVADTDGNGIFTTSVISSFDDEIRVDQSSE
jgi:prepilin-type N-terminal cleavage/methylation domain-containing protein